MSGRPSEGTQAWMISVFPCGLGAYLRVAAGSCGRGASGLSRTAAESLCYVLKRTPRLAAVVATSPGLASGVRQPAAKLLAGRLLSRVAPTPRIPLDSPMSGLSHDLAWIEATGRGAGVRSDLAGCACGVAGDTRTDRAFGSDRRNSVTGCSPDRHRRRGCMPRGTEGSSACPRSRRLLRTIRVPNHRLARCPPAHSWYRDHRSLQSVVRRVPNQRRRTTRHDVG
jgi:hypothetical protein